jgi:hypothetical protein
MMQQLQRGALIEHVCAQRIAHCLAGDYVLLHNAAFRHTLSTVTGTVDILRPDNVFSVYWLPLQFARGIAVYKLLPKTAVGDLLLPQRRTELEHKLRQALSCEPRAAQILGRAPLGVCVMRLMENWVLLVHAGLTERQEVTLWQQLSALPHDSDDCLLRQQHLQKSSTAPPTVALPDTSVTPKSGCKTPSDSHLSALQMVEHPLLVGARQEAQDNRHFLAKCCFNALLDGSAVDGDDLQPASVFVYNDMDYSAAHGVVRVRNQAIDGAQAFQHSEYGAPVWLDSACTRFMFWSCQIGHRNDPVGIAGCLPASCASGAVGTVTASAPSLPPLLLATLSDGADVDAASSTGQVDAHAWRAAYRLEHTSISEVCAFAAVAAPLPTSSPLAAFTFIPESDRDDPLDFLL